MPQATYTSQARLDLLRVWTDIAIHDPRAADGMLDRIEKRVQILASWPQAGAIYPTIGAEARMLVERPYLILYRFSSGVVQIVRVLHGARDIDAAEFLLGLD